MRIAVLGAGSWGTAIALLLAGRAHDVTLWARSSERARALARERENELYLPGFSFPPELRLSSDLAGAVEGAEMLVVTVPVQYIRGTLSKVRGICDQAVLRVGAAKGIERDSLMRVSELLVDIWGEGVYAVLSGPSFALEVARGEPTAVTLASEDIGVAGRVQREISTDLFRVYASDDVIGVELAGALKNVIAIAAGIVRGLGYGSNTLAALITRGLAELGRLGAALGGRPETFLGLAGMGDLTLTSTGSLSRNTRLGEAVARGATLADVEAGSSMVAEGVETARSAAALATRHGVDMPITWEVVNVLFHGRDPRAAVRSLMSRDLKAE